MNYDQFFQALMGIFEAEENDGFRVLRRIPSSIVYRFLSVYNELPAKDRTATKRALVRQELKSFGIEENPEDEEILERLKDSAFAAPLISPIGVRSASQASLAEAARHSIGKLLGAKPKRTGEPGEAEFLGKLDGSAVEIRMRIRNMPYMLEYSVLHKDYAAYVSPGKITRLSYEGLLGFGVGLWDQLGTVDIEETVKLLNECIERTVLGCGVLAGTIRTSEES